MSENLIIKAARFAYDCHLGQFRKWTRRPYITHPMRVAGAVAIIPGATEVEVAAAWLHDVIEDCQDSCDEQKLVDEFGEPVRRLVAELTNTSKGLKDSYGLSLNRASRKKVDRERIAGCSLWARRIKLIDRADNVAELDHSSDFARTYYIETLLLVQAIAESTDDKFVQAMVCQIRHDISNKTCATGATHDC